MASEHSTTNTTGVAAQSLLDPHHKNPFEFDSTDPLVLFIVQAVIIISFCNLIGLIFKPIRQPKVISEVIGGIILGPTAMGRIPHFSNAIFPKQSLPFLSLVANIGLVLFLFIVGLEVDFKLMKKNWRPAAGIGLIGLVVPFGIGAAVAVGVYNQFIDHSAVDFGHFLLFICVAFSITAFPVLCRILTELKLLQSDVGLAVLAAGVANDVIGWILLALAVTLVNSGAGLTALYVMLVVFGWVIFLAFVIRPFFIVIAKRSGSFETGPTPGITCLVLLMTFASAWFTQVIGVHAIFGGFLVGVIMPHDGGFANILASKIEDLVTVFFLPLYFTLSGLSTDLGQLKDGSIWGWTICVLIAAEVSKFLPCFGVAMWGGMDWRESGAVGSLMACKGLVELIVLNIALKAGVLNSAVFAMFVLMAVVTTFATTPLCLAFYPESYRLAKGNLKNLQKTKSKSIHDKDADDDGDIDQVTIGGQQPLRFLVVLSQIEHLPGVMAFMKLLKTSSEHMTTSESQLLSRRTSRDETKLHELDPISITPFENKMTVPGVLGFDRSARVSALRLSELSQRTSDVMKASEVAETSKCDPILNIFNTFAVLNGVMVSKTKMSIVPSEDFGKEIVRQAEQQCSQMIILPWSTNMDRAPRLNGSSVNPIEMMISGRMDSSPQYANLIRKVFEEASCDVGILVDSGFDHESRRRRARGSEQRLFCVFLGGEDDRTSAKMAMKLSEQSNLLAEFLRVVKVDQLSDVQEGQEELKGPSEANPRAELMLQKLTVSTGEGSRLAMNLSHRSLSQTMRVESESSDDEVWQEVTTASETNERIRAVSVRSVRPFETVMERVKSIDCEGLIVLSGRGSQEGSKGVHETELAQYLKARVDGVGFGSEDLKDESNEVGRQREEEIVRQIGILASAEVRKSLGAVPSGLVGSGLKAKVLVIRSYHSKCIPSGTGTMKDTASRKSA